MAEAENTASIVHALVSKTVHCTIRYSFIAEIMAPYAWYQMLPQICSITIEFYLSIAYHAYCFILGSCQQYIRHDKHWMNNRLSVVTSRIHINQILF